MIPAKTIGVIGKFVRQKRKESNLTQEEAAGLSNVGKRFFSELENGKRSLEIGKVFEVLHSLGIDIFLQKRGK
ncbi:helix-turn-helix transcriptional regulator [bacterium]|nr:helix-turn-helix transcriptional regulator [bacterium]